jgi:hypothetical protein
MWYHNHNYNWKNDLFWSIPFLTRFCEICLELYHPISTSLHFATIISFYKERPSDLRPTCNVEARVSVLMLPRRQQAAKFTMEATWKPQVTHKNYKVPENPILSIILQRKRRGEITVALPAVTFLCNISVKTWDDDPGAQNVSDREGTRNVTYTFPNEKIQQQMTIRTAWEWPRKLQTS